MKEPIKNPIIWVGLGLLALFNAPWYLPVCAIEPYVLGVPAWAMWVLLLSATLSMFLTWACLTQWNLIEDQEEAHRD